MPYSALQCFLFEMAYLKLYLYTKLGRPIRGRENLNPVGTHMIQGKCGYPCLTPNALLRKAVCSARDVLLRTVSIYKAGQTYNG